MPNYANSIVYKICCDDPAVKEIYIGSTTNFKKRKQAHKSSCCKEGNAKYNLYVYRFIRDNGGWSNWSMVQIEAIELNTKRELHARERHWLETLGAGLNKQVPLRTPAELREDNKEQLKVMGKAYRLANKESEKERHRVYYYANLDKVKAYREANKEKAKAYLKAYHKIHYEANKDVKSCAICGGKFNHGENSKIKRHAKSKRHIKALESQ